MLRQLASFWVVAGILLAPISGAASTDLTKDRAAIEQIVKDCTGWALTKDFKRLEEILAHDDLFYFQQGSKGTIDGWDAFTKLYSFWKDPRFKATRYELRDLRISFSCSGDVAWYSCILDDCMEWKGKAFCLNDTRWTGVLEKRNGKWVIVQMHYSFASDKAVEEAQKKEDEEMPDRLRIGGRTFRLQEEHGRNSGGKTISVLGRTYRVVDSSGQDVTR